MRIYQHRITVPEDAVDANGHVNNVQYVQWMQDAAVRHADSVGCSGLTAARGATWVVRSHSVEYLRPAFAGERISVLTWVCDFRRVRSLRRYAFVRESDGVRLATGATDWIYVDAASGRPLSIPEEVSGVFTVVAPGEEP